MEKCGNTPSPPSSKLPGWDGSMQRRQFASCGSHSGTYLANVQLGHVYRGGAQSRAQQHNVLDLVLRSAQAKSSGVAPGEGMALKLSDTVVQVAECAVAVTRALVWWGWQDGAVTK